MKWKDEECKRGDMIRVRHGSIYHFGIYVSDEEVIQFGDPPLIRDPKKSDKDMQVSVTDVSGFACGKCVERAVFSIKERCKKFSREKVVSRARSRIGEKGYNFLHNNCEHFCYECVFGKKYSSQEESLRKKWNVRRFLKVYVTDLAQNTVFETLYPPERQKEISSVKNREVKEQKYTAWQLLSYALNDAFALKLKDVEFKKTQNGKWTAKGFHFSVTHSENKVAVALSSGEVGIDLEMKERFFKKYSDEKNVVRLGDKIVSKNESFPQNAMELLVLWTKKESAFKYVGKGGFYPRNTDTEKYCFEVFDKDEYILTVCKEPDLDVQFKEVNDL